MKTTHEIASRLENEADVRRTIVDLARLTLGIGTSAVDGCDDARLDEQEVDEQTLLEHIRSDSIQAINLVVLIEDEFSIELDDEEIDLEFFECFDLITKLVVRHLNITYTGS